MTEFDGGLLKEHIEPPGGVIAAEMFLG